MRCTNACPSSQVAKLFVGNATERGIPTIEAPGEALHIDWLNFTASDDEFQIQMSSKSYLDWYMLTKARSRPCQDPGPGFQGVRQPKVD